MSTTEKGLIWLAGPESEIVEVSGWLEGIGFDVVVAADAPEESPLGERWADCALVLHDDTVPDSTIREIDRARTLPSIPPIIVLGNERELSQRLEDRIDVVFLESTTSQEHFLSTFCEGLTKIVSNSKRLIFSFLRPSFAKLLKQWYSLTMMGMSSLAIARSTDFLAVQMSRSCSPFSTSSTA